MNKKYPVIMAIVAILTVSIGAFTATSLDFDNEFGKTKTNPAEFVNQNYLPMQARYITTDAMEIASLSDDIIKGEIVDIQTRSVPVADSEPGLEAPMIDNTTYTIKVSDKIKGDKSTIDIVTHIPSKIEYNIGDKVLVMSSSFGEQNMLIGGPHSMFKLENGKAIGDEFTFDEESFSNAIKTSEDRSKELPKAKGP